MQEEHKKLTNEIHQLKSELESQTKRRSALEQENATLLERVSQFDQQRVCGTLITWPDILWGFVFFLQFNDSTQIQWLIHNILPLSVPVFLIPNDNTRESFLDQFLWFL